MATIKEILVADEQKVVKWFESKEPLLITAIKTGVVIADKLIAFDKSAGGAAIIAYVESLVPAAQPWTAEVIQITQSLATDMAAATNPASWEGIGLRLAAEVAKIIDGGKLPTGISGYLAEVQAIFVG